MRARVARRAGSQGRRLCRSVGPCLEETACQGHVSILHGPCAFRRPRQSAIGERKRNLMYILLDRGSGGAISGNHSAQAPSLWQRKERMSPGLGQPMPSIPSCVPKPRWIAPFKHFFSPRTPVFWSVHPFRGRWDSTPTHDELRPDRLNPGYIDSATHGLIRDPNLDKKLHELMTNLLAKRPPFNSEPFKTFVDKGGKIRVALVDLSTDLKLLSPKVAEFNSTQMTEGASLAKIGLLYAAFQHRFDLTVEGTTRPASMTAERIRKAENNI